MRVQILFGLLLLGAASTAFSASSDKHPAVGHWLGMAEDESRTMRYDMVISLEDDTLQAEFILIDEGGARLPADKVEHSDQTIRLSAMQDAIVLEGEIDGNELRGTLRFPAGELPTQLAREGSPQAQSMINELEERIARLRGEPLKLVRSGPAMDSVDSKALEELLAGADASFTTAMALLHDGELVGEWYRGDKPRPIHTMSVTKVAVHLVIGRLITLELLDSIDVPVHEFYPQWRDDDQRAQITIRHLLAHTSGLDRGQPAIPIYQSDDFVQYALDAPLEAEPGARVIYSNNATNLLGGIIDRIIDGPLEEFLADDLFGRLGIEHFSWDPDPAGNPQGMAGLQLTAGDLARLGQLALNRGHWQGEQLIDADFFEQSFQPGSEHSRRVGLIWFLEYEDDRVVGASHSGHLGQWLGVRFDNGIVGARLIANSPAYDPETDAFDQFLELLPLLPEHAVKQ